MTERMCPMLTAAIWANNGGIGIEPCRKRDCEWYDPDGDCCGLAPVERPVQDDDDDE